MGKYSPLRDHLKLAPHPLSLTFDDVARLVGGLPRSAFEHRPWWANDATHMQARAWVDAGRRVEDVDLNAGHVRFS